MAAIPCSFSTIVTPCASLRPGSGTDSKHFCFSAPLVPRRTCKPQLPKRKDSVVRGGGSSRVVQRTSFGRGSSSSVGRASAAGAGPAAAEAAETAEGSILEELDVKSCVREIYSEEEFDETLAEAAASRALVVVDFFRTACGSCRYIEKGYAKLCVVEMTAEREDEAKGLDPHPVIFLKHNVMDEYDERSELADRLKIRVVPMFQFYWDGQLVDTFATRDKARVMGAILRHTGRESQEEGEQPQQQQQE